MLVLLICCVVVSYCERRGASNWLLALERFVIRNTTLAICEFAVFCTVVGGGAESISGGVGGDGYLLRDFAKLKKKTLSFVTYYTHCMLCLKTLYIL